jgi:hypothetical protein
MCLNLSRALALARASLFSLEYNGEREVSSLYTCTLEYPLSKRLLSLRVVYERVDIKYTTLSENIIYNIYNSLREYKIQLSLLPSIILPSSLSISSGAQHV